MTAALCYDACSESSWGDFNLTVSGKFSRTEPNLRYNTTASRFETLQHWEQLSALGHAFQGRHNGLLDLIPNEMANLLTRTINRRQITYQRPGRFGDVFKDRQSFEGSTTRLFSDFHSNLVDDTLKETGRASLALQAYSTSLVRMAYYDNLGLFDAESSHKISSWLTAELTQTTTGLKSVLTLLAVHLLLVLCVLFSFIRRSRYTLLDNCWHVLAQVVSSEADSVIRCATLATDEEVRVLELRENARIKVAPKILADRFTVMLRHKEGYGHLSTSFDQSTSCRASRR